MGNLLRILLLLFISVNTFAQNSIYQFGLKNSLPKTDQTTSYTTNDDGTYQAGSVTAPRFVDNGDGTITDKLTGLMWVKEPQKIIPGTSVLSSNQIQAAKGNWATTTAYSIGDIVADGTTIYVCCVAHTSGSGTFATDRSNNPTYWRQTVWKYNATDLTTPVQMTFTDAITNCEGLEYAGYSDWRLPNVKEVCSIQSHGNTSYINTTFFPNVYNGGYWSSTTNPGTTANAQYINFSNGSTSNNTKTSPYAVRPVRGGR